MRKVRLGRTGVEVSAVSLGTWGHGGPSKSGSTSVGWSGHDDALAREAIVTAWSGSRDIRSRSFTRSSELSSPMLQTVVCCWVSGNPSRPPPLRHSVTLFPPKRRSGSGSSTVPRARSLRGRVASCGLPVAGCRLRVDLEAAKGGERSVASAFQAGAFGRPFSQPAKRAIETRGNRPLMRGGEAADGTSGSSLELRRATGVLFGDLKCLVLRDFSLRRRE
jgi:hypothetical protein